MFYVEVEHVRTVNSLGKTKRFGQMMGRRNHSKKAYVKLKPGFDIEFGGAQKLSAQFVEKDKDDGTVYSKADLPRPPLCSQGGGAEPAQGRAARGAGRATPENRRPHYPRPRHRASSGWRSQAAVARRRNPSCQDRPPG